MNKNGFYNFENGAKIEADRVDEWRDEIVKKLKNRERGTIHTRSSGRAIVIGIRTYEEDIGDHVEVIVVRNGYHHYEYKVKKQKA